MGNLKIQCEGVTYVTRKVMGNLSSDRQVMDLDCHIPSVHSVTLKLL